MKNPEEQWLDYSISFTAEYTYTHALFKGRAFLSLLYWMLEISVPKLQITSLTSKKFPKQITLFKENRQALQMQGICSCACPGASRMVLDCWIIISQLPMRRFSEVWCRHQLRGPSFNRAFILCRLCKSQMRGRFSLHLVNLQGRSRAPRPSQSHEFTGVGLEAQSTLRSHRAMGIAKFG